MPFIPHSRAHYTYASEHGVEHYVVERLSKPRGKAESRSGRRKQTKFIVREFLQQMQVLVPRVGGKLHRLNPAYISIDAIPLSKKPGLDIHTTSPYLLATRIEELKEARKQVTV